MIDFQPGQIYLVKGSPSRFWWVYSSTGLPTPQLLWHPSKELFKQQVETSSLFTEGSLVVIPGTDSIHPAAIPDSDTYVFILLTDGVEPLSSSGEKVYKNLSGGIFQQVDLTQLDPLTDERLEPLLMRLSSEVRETLTADLTNPFRLHRQLTLLSDSESSLLDYDSFTPSTREAISLIECLGIPQGLEKWRSLSTKAVYGLFLSEGNRSCIMHEILAGKGKRYGMCPALWFYLELFLESLLPSYPHAPQRALSLFATWVYLASTVWANVRQKGWYSSIYKGRIYWNFQPSRTAHLSMNELLGAKLPNF